MANRSYLLLGLEPELPRERLVKLVQALERLDEVTFAEHVAGPFDLLVSAESAGPAEELRDRVRELEGVRQVVLLKAQIVSARERMWRAINSVPARPQG